MKRTILCLVAGFGLLLASGWAQDSGGFGLLMRVDPSPRVGATFSLGRAFVVRPYVGFSRETVDAERERRFPPLNDQQNFVPPRQETEEERTFVTAGLGVFFVAHRAGDFFVFSGLNFGYGRSTGETNAMPRDLSWDESSETLQSSAVLGVEGRLSSHLALFGEVGFGYTWSKYKRDNGVDAKVTSHRWGLANSGVGLIFYF